MIKLGIIGAGRVARIHAKAIQKIKGASLISIFDQEYTRANEFARAFGSRSFKKIEDFWKSPVEAVIICVPTFFHKKYAVEAVQMGKHVLCEKPIASSLSEADEMIISVKKAKVKFMVGHVLRFHPAFCQIKNLLQKGELGSIRHIHASRVSGAAHASWAGWLLEHPAGLGALDLSIHDLDLLQWFLGKASSVMAMGVANERGNFFHVDMLFTFQHGAKACIEGSFLVPRHHPFQYKLRILGDQGCISFAYSGMTYSDAKAQQNLLYYRDEKIDILEIQDKDPYEEEICYFLQCIKEDLNIELGTAEEAKIALEMALAAKKSAELGLPVDL